jgi:hypothetical protein
LNEGGKQGLAPCDRGSGALCMAALAACACRIAWSGNLDPRLSPGKRANSDFSMSRMIIYAVKPFEWMDNAPKVDAVSRDYAAQIRSEWRHELDFLRNPT